MNFLRRREGKAIFGLIIGVHVFMSSIIFSGMESKLIYYPIDKKIRNIWITTQNNILDIYFFSRDGVKLNAWYVKPEKDKPVIIYCHGQGENISNWQNIVKFLTDKGYGVFMLEYRGHGKSSGEPFESGLYIDLESAVKYLQTYEKIPQNNMILWGRSLGGAVVADIASRGQFKAVILESTFTNIRDEAVYLTKNGMLENELGLWSIFSSFFVEYMPITQKFSTDKKIYRIKSPLLIGHSVNDTTVPVSMSYKLAKLNHFATLYVSNNGSHHESDWFFPEVLEFIEKPEKAPIPNPVSISVPHADKHA